MEVILITAGNGYVGQHVIKHLQLYGPATIKTIRVLDQAPFAKKLDYKTRFPVTSVVSNAFDDSVLETALNGVDTVIHLRELRDISVVPDAKAMRKMNVEDTKILLKACEKAKVKRFVLLTSGDVMLCNHVACDAHVGESWAVPINNWAYPAYCSSKYEAEKAVFECDSLQSFAVRLIPNYGELEEHQFGFHSNLKLAKQWNGTLPVLGDRMGKIMHCYIGNFAYGVVKTLQKMIDEPTATKEAVFFTDESPVMDFYSQLEPYANARKFKFFNLPVWFLMVFLLVWIVERLAGFVDKLISFVRPRFSRIPASRILYNFLYNYITFNGFKAEYFVGYKPLYSPTQAMENSMSYYAKCDL